ncbi:YidH family protein [Haloferula chungangensis]|uniref:YidH family protein n=1 Tax=Haloferula chungangensis TaxID=1048331 RepID=A0ABW2L2M3_9BACT
MSDPDRKKPRSEKLAEKRTKKAKERSDLAEERTSFAEDRTLLANERTFAGWAKASFAAIALGLGFQALFRRAEPVWVPKCVATLFILLGIALIWLAERRAVGLLNERNGNHVNLTSPRTFLLLAISVTVGGLVLIASIWFLI